MLLQARQILVGRLRLFKRKDLRIDDRVDIVCLNGSHNILHHGLRPHDCTACGAHLVEAVEHALRDVCPPRNPIMIITLELDGFQSLLEGVCGAYLDDVVETHAIEGESSSSLPPVDVFCR